ncbi:MAG TPA: S8 family serine peptidase [Herpetosiphonaceae bacterium]|nr:S8 family serine peptidase [Herpetosiphonaceae bacterium]
MRSVGRAFGLVVAAVLAIAALVSPRGTSASGVIVDAALRQAMSAAAPDAVLSAIVTYDHQPAADDLSALTALGISAAPLQKLPMVGVLATASQLERVESLAGIRSLYLNRPMEYFLRETVGAIGALDVRSAYGYQGDGVGVAVIDTGVDGTHADLTLGEETVQNVKIVGLQYAAGVDLDTLNLPRYYLEDQQNTDTTGGHGTHVAGIIGASGQASNGRYTGVAPKADLIGLGAGDGIEIFSALAGFDWVLANQQELNIRVVNCSWGNIIPGFDPDNPVNVATKAVHDAGVAVVFAAGNSGSKTDTLNTYSVAPWVIGVAAGGNVETLNKTEKSVASFSSRGIPGDDFYHPTLTAPGALVISDRSSTGTTTNATTAATDPLLMAYLDPEGVQYLPYYTIANGTSMAAPHVAGAIALLVEANPSLTPDVIKRVLVNTATPMPDFQEYAAGAGYLDVKAAVDQALAIRNVRSYRDPRTGKDEQVYDLTGSWNGTVDASLPGMVASDLHTVDIPEGTVSLDVAVDWDLVTSDLSLYLYDPQGNLQAKSEVQQVVSQYANETVHVDAPVAGTWTVKVSGNLNAPQAYTGTSNAVVLVHP